MKLTCVLLFLTFQTFAVGGYSQTVSLNVEKATLQKLFAEIENQTGVLFFYNADWLQKANPVTIKVKNTPLQKALDLCFSNQPLSYSLVGNTVVIALKKIEPAPQASQAVAAIDVTGRIVDEQGQPLQGANVQVKNSTNGTITDAGGNFSLRNVPEGAVLVISFTGYTTLEVGAQSRLGDVRLSLTVDRMTEVTVTGYTNYRRDKSPSASAVVTSDKINQVPGLTVDQILQGRVPGMSVISSSGQPGQSASVVIRGIGSINGSSAPLFVMDGVPIESNYFQTINPEDIESATVLKDASAKALYGSRGSNGVVVITTKKGRRGGVSVQYNSQYGFSNLSRPNFIMMNTEQRLRFEEEVGVMYNRNLGPGWAYSPKNPAYAAGTDAFRQRADAILDSLRGVDVDWRDFFFRRGTFQEQQVAVSGGNEGLRFYNSINYYKQEGVARRTGLERYTLRSNLDFNSGKFSGSTNLALGYSKSSFTEGEGSTSVGTAMSAVYYALPYEYPYAPNGVLVHPGNRSQYGVLDLREGSQALERLLNTSNKTDQLKAIVSTAFAYQLLPNLKLSTRAGVDYRNSNDLYYINPDSYFGSRNTSTTLGGRGRLEQGNRRNFNIISTSGVTFADVFNDVHDVEVSGFYEYNYNNYNSYGFTGFGIDGRLAETPAGVTNGNPTFLPAIGGGKSSSALASFMTVARYTYNDKYTITGSYRYDGSTRVAPVNKWHGFYSFGASWMAKNEAFLKDVDLISDLRIRTSYGLTASPLGSDFAYLPTYAIGGNASYGGVPGIRPQSPGNPAYDWEYVREFNAGFDLGLFASRRLRIVADFYNRITSNMFFDQPLSATSGFTTLPLSTGKMRNRGVEFEVAGDVIRSKDFTWSLGVNAAYNKNTILYLTPLATELLDGDTRIFKVGYPYGTYYAPDWAGVNPETGEAQYRNLDGTITTVYNSAAQSTTNSGSLFPTLTGGFTTGLSWKGLTLNALFSFVSDVMRWNNEDFYNENQRYASSNQTLRMLEDRWKKPGDVTTLQRFDIPRNYTSKDIQDASFLRLRNVNLGYSLPASLVQKTKLIKGARVFVQGQNLLTWTKWRGLDPENNNVYGRFQYPNTRTYTAGLNVNF
ncbi:MAG: SusC/RagA family TonB-linked outer membrane protein [Chitinophagaceae bacterium]|nr:MAG: SusC/RagA family TonB-linked outer membrane protein [Chitinophagaceae bacterium]